VDLAELAKNLDELEQAALAEGTSTPDPSSSSIPFKSSNVDDDGFFSSQVLISALSTFSLTLHPQTEINVSSERAFIINQNQHWFAFRYNSFSKTQTVYLEAAFGTTLIL
jgi:hypothetical protein